MNISVLLLFAIVIAIVSVILYLIPQTRQHAKFVLVTGIFVEILSLGWRY